MVRRVYKMTRREDGYYWIRMKNFYNQWQPARWDEEKWWIIGTEEEYGDANITEVGERIKEPEKRR